MSTINISPGHQSGPRSYTQAELRSFVADAELAPLLATLAFLLGDDQLVADELRPPLTPAQAEIFPQGGMTEEQQARAREAAAAGLRRYLSGERSTRPISTERLLAYLTGGAGSEYAALLEHELGLSNPAEDRRIARTDISALRVAVIGAGMSGMAMAYNLAREGASYVLFEKNDDIGGTWLENRYPGCRLDTNNFAYSFSFAQRSDWPDAFSRRDDIWAYFNRIADEFEMNQNVRLNTLVTELRFDDATRLWRVTSQAGSGKPVTETFDVVVSAVGQLNTPSLPDIPGIDDFEGTYCHSARWGSDVVTDSKRVGVIGSGASAYQIVPTIVDDVSTLSVFQRTPPWMMPTPGYQKSLKPGMSTLLTLLPEYARWFRFWQFWLAAEGRMRLVTVDPDWDREAHDNTVSPLNLLLRTQLVERMRAQYTDRPDLLDRVIPTYPPGGKRLLRDDGVWARALKSPRTELITDPIERVTPSGVMLTSGREVGLDVLVYATGFDASNFLSTVTVTGVGGADLHESWSGEARAYKGISVPKFPGLFLLYGPNTNLVVTGSAIFMSECAAEYTVRVLKETVRRGEGPLDVTQDAFDRYVDEIETANRLRAWGVDGVSNWYKTASGTVTQNWPLSLHRYFEDSRIVESSHYVPVASSTVSAQKSRPRGAKIARLSPASPRIPAVQTPAQKKEGQ